jgi:hypothetical protein
MCCRFCHLLGIVAMIGINMIGTCEAEAPEWESRFLNTIQQYEGSQSTEAIEKLGRIVGMLASGQDPQLLESRAFKLARERVLQIPGFADHFKQKILAISAWENGESTVETLEQSGWYFIILSQLPHPDTVRVLGELLHDDRDPTKGSPSHSPHVPNSVHAAYALHEIGLQRPPVAGRYGNARKDLPTWRLWFEQVQHGKSFSFVGDTRTYTLAESSLSAATRKSRRPKPNEGVPADSSNQWVTKPEVWLILILLLVTVTVAASRFLRSPIR